MCHTLNTATPPLPSACASCHGTAASIIAAQTLYGTVGCGTTADCHGVPSPTPTSTRTPTPTASATVTATGAYSWKYKPLKKGTFRVKASIATTATYKASKTAYKTFKVK